MHAPDFCPMEEQTDPVFEQRDKLYSVLKIKDLLIL